MSWPAFRLARRELRGSLKGFGTVVACLALGVAAIAAAASLDAALRRALAEDARALLGGDAELRLTYRPTSGEETAFLSQFGTLSHTVEMRAMARRQEGDRQTLVELKGIDRAYPLYGRLDLDPQQPPAQALGWRDGSWGAAADPNLLDRLGLKLGDRVTVGNAVFTLRASIAREPDRVASVFSFGPRLLIDGQALATTGLVQPGSLIRYAVLIKLKDGTTPATFHQAVDRRFPDAGWIYRDSSRAAPGIKRFLDNMTMFLTLVGLTALMVGGIGVANGVTAFLDERIATIATMKCLGASRRLIVSVYFLQIAALAGLGILLGVAVGAAVPWVVVAAWGNHLPVAAHLGLYPRPLALAAGFGALTALAFATWPLARAGQIPPATLFRDIVVGRPGWPGPGALAIVGVAGSGLAGLALLSSAHRGLAAWFIGGTTLAFGLFTACGAALVTLTQLAARRRADNGGRPALRLALSSLHRPGAPTRGVVLSLGLGLTVLVAVALVEANLSRQVAERLPAEAPTFFFIDIQPDQVEAFERAVRQAGGEELGRAPMIRGRVTRINGVPVEQVAIAPDAQWAVRGDRGLTTAAARPEDAKVEAGDWWPADYDGPPLVSLDANIARGFGLSLGQTVTVNVLGREITARLANTRDIDWSTLSMNFTFILTPNALAGAPSSVIATVHAPPGKETAVERAVTQAVPTVSSIRVKEALDQVRQLIASAGMAIRAAAAVCLAAGALVLAGAIAAGQARRIHEAVLLKVLGARRRDLLKALLVEYGLLGAATGAVAAVLGSAAAWGVVVHVLNTDWTFLPWPVATTVLGSVAAVGAFGVVGTMRALAAKPAPYLRHD
jgi:putative ABC transport system permease protein